MGGILEGELKLNQMELLFLVIQPNINFQEASINYKNLTEIVFTNVRFKFLIIKPRVRIKNSLWEFETQSLIFLKHCSMFIDKLLYKHLPFSR